MMGIVLDKDFGSYIIRINIAHKVQMTIYQCITLSDQKYMEALLSGYDKLHPRIRKKLCFYCWNKAYFIVELP